MQIDLNKYQDFVREVTSEPSNHTDKLVDRLNELNTNHTLNPALLLTAAMGLAAEGGEFVEIPKKIISKIAKTYHKQSLTQDIQDHEDFVELYDKVAK